MLRHGLGEVYSHFRVLSLQSIAQSSNKTETGAMLLVTKESCESSVTCCAKGANIGPTMHCVLSSITFYSCAVESFA